MEIQDYLEHYLAGKRQQRIAVFEDAASTSILMHGVKYLCQHFYHLFDWYCRWFMLFRLRWTALPSADDVWTRMGKYYADAIDIYHLLWVGVTFLLYLVGWHLLYDKPSEAKLNWYLWMIPVGVCAYRVFEILAALVEMYFRDSDTKHHQFRILLHAGLHYLSAGCAFALFYIFADWGFESFTPKNDDSQFMEWSEPLFNSMMTIVAFGGYDQPQNWQGKLLTLLELMIGFMLVTFIFLNITQVWYGSRAQRE
ncbi:MAG TPA: hypothetical protein VFE62_11155 [Gemmataceae bacterium]|nr:hypothetical protein [Gemmataceae bacterium]